MTLFTSLSVAAIAFFAAHVILLIASFTKGSFHRGRYLWSHITLWITGAIVFFMAGLFAGKGEYGLLDLFDTVGKRLLILITAFALSGLAHLIVRYLVLGRTQTR
jgi:hypothetical protein